MEEDGYAVEHVLYDRRQRQDVGKRVKEEDSRSLESIEVEHVLYDRRQRQGVGKRVKGEDSRSLESKEDADNGILDKRHPELPFSFVAGMYSGCAHKSQPYVHHILQTVQDENVPRNLQSIIKGCDFECPDTHSDLSVILRRLEPNCNVMLSEHATQVKSHVTGIIDRLSHKLRKTGIPIFDGVTAVMLGSAAEETKTFLPNEWDFVLFLPYLWKENKHRFPVNSIGFRLEQETKKAVLSMFLENKLKEDYFAYYEQVADDLMKFVAKVFESIVEDVILKSICFDHKALAVTITLDGLDIKMDISFGIRDESKSSICDTSSLVKPLNEQPPHGFYILSGSSFTYTATFEEVRRMQNLPSNIKLCYQIVKCLIEEYIPQYTFSCSCNRSLFPSFHLKMILFYMCEYYDGEKYWSHDQLPSRILEMFIVYSICLRFGRINNMLSIPGTELTKVAKYINFSDSDDSYLLCIAKKDLIECFQKFSDISDNCEAFKSFKSFLDIPEPFYRRYNADIISAFCILLHSLKQSNDLEPRERVLYDRLLKTPSHPRTVTEKYSEGLRRSKGACELDRLDETSGEIPAAPKENACNRTGEYKMQQLITMEGGVEAMEVVPHDGMLLITFLDTLLQDACLIKYKWNEIIQETTLPYSSHDMCYHNECITVVFQNEDVVKTYNYKDLSEISSFTLHSNCVSITALEDDSLVCLLSEGRVIRTTSGGDTLFSSLEFFKTPGSVISIRTQNRVAVSDLKDYSITCLSSDLQDKVFVFKQSENRLFYPKGICWNDEKKCIFVYQNLKGPNLEISDTGDLIKEFDIEGMVPSKDFLKTSVCYNRDMQLLVIGFAYVRNIYVFKYNS